MRKLYTFNVGSIIKSCKYFMWEILSLHVFTIIKGHDFPIQNENIWVNIIKKIYSLAIESLFNFSGFDMYLLIMILSCHVLFF